MISAPAGFGKTTLLAAWLAAVAAENRSVAWLFFVFPTLSLLLPAPVTDHFVQYLPSNVGGVLTGSPSGLTHPLTPWTGFALLCAYATVLIGLAAWRLRRVDA